MKLSLIPCQRMLMAVYIVWCIHEAWSARTEPGKEVSHLNL